MSDHIRETSDCSTCTKIKQLEEQIKTYVRMYDQEKKIRREEYLKYESEFKLLKDIILSAMSGKTGTRWDNKW